MSLIIKFEISCNRCMRTVIFSTPYNFIDDIGASIPEGWENPYDRGVTDDDYLLCPECLKIHNEMMEKPK